MLCLYFMGLNLSNNQIGDELELNEDSISPLTSISPKIVAIAAMVEKAGTGLLLA